MSRTKYRMLKDSKLEQRAVAGSIVYMPNSWDFGCAADDTRLTGVEHISVTLDPDGGNPFFTVPLDDVERVDDPKPHTQATTDTERERSAFEAWILCTRAETWMRSRDGYLSPEADAVWRAWLAAKAHARGEGTRGEGPCARCEGTGYEPPGAARWEDGMADALHRIKQWSEAYPVEIFPEPVDWKKAESVLKEAGLSLTSISAHNMRHVITKVQEIADAALTERPGHD